MFFYIACYGPDTVQLWSIHASLANLTAFFMYFSFPTGTVGCQNSRLAAVSIEDEII
jgi:hypothetical protein